MPNASHRIIIEDDSLDRLFVETGPGVALVPVRTATVQAVNDAGEWRGCGAERGDNPRLCRDAIVEPHHVSACHVAVTERSQLVGGAEDVVPGLLELLESALDAQ